MKALVIGAAILIAVLAVSHSGPRVGASGALKNGGQFSDTTTGDTGSWPAGTRVTVQSTTANAVIVVAEGNPNQKVGLTSSSPDGTPK